MLGMINATTAIFTSVTSASRGVPSVGKPKPIAPFTKAASSTAAAPGIVSTASIAGWVRGSGRQRVPEHFRRVSGPATGQMLDLLATGHPGGDDLGVRGRGFHRWRQSPVAQPNRDVIVLLLEAEGSGHAAAPGIDLTHLEAGPA